VQTAIGQSAQDDLLSFELDKIASFARSQKPLLAFPLKFKRL
jgi:hypothetical protein